MLEFTKGLLMEILGILVIIQVILLLIPKSLKKILKAVTKIICRSFKGIFHQVKKLVLKHMISEKKAVPEEEQPNENVITVKYPDNKVKEFKAK